LDDLIKAPQEIEDSKSPRLASVSKKDGKQKRWKETTKQWKNFRELVEKLQDEVAKYKQAEEQLKQQLAKLKAANEKLQHEIAESKQAVKLSDLRGPRTVASFGKQQNRMYDDRQLLVEDS
jgi:peptidoglycan hydrolase CwlO-like protein